MAKPKSDFPPILMEKAKRKLSPGTAFDEERLDTFADGKLWITITQDTPPKMIRTWWAVLNTVVTECPCPWKNTEQASAAIKLALGHVTPFKTVGGEWRSEAKSLHDFNSEKDAWDFLDSALALLERITGVPRNELIKHAPDTGPDCNTNSPDPNPEGLGEGSGESLSKSQPAPNTPAGEADQGEDGSRDDQPSSPSDLNSNSLRVECIDKLMELATLYGKSIEDRQGRIIKAKDAWKQELPEDQHGFLKTVFDTANKVAKGEQKPEVARKYLDGLVVK